MHLALHLMQAGAQVVNQRQHAAHLADLRCQVAPGGARALLACFKLRLARRQVVQRTQRPVDAVEVLHVLDLPARGVRQPGERGEGGADAGD